MRVLVVEDYEPLRTAMAQGLREAGYAVDVAADGEDGLWLARESAPDVVILDLMLPRLDGLSLLRALRATDGATEVLVLTARDTVDDRVNGLNEGADDYLVKPFAFAELLARVGALVRRRYHNSAPLVRVGRLELDTSARLARLDGQELELTAREYGLLELLARRAGQVVTRDEIRDALYDFAAEPASNVIDVYIGYLRQKTEQGGRPRLIHTRRGLGYQMSEEGR